MRQEHDEGEHDKDDNQEERDAQRKPAKCLQQELDKEDDKDAVEEGAKTMTGIEFTGMDGIGIVHLPGIETVRHDFSSNDWQKQLKFQTEFGRRGNRVLQHGP
jgi:hypothetical protein